MARAKKAPARRPAPKKKAPAKRAPSAKAPARKAPAPKAAKAKAKKPPAKKPATRKKAAAAKAPPAPALPPEALPVPPGALGPVVAAADPVVSAVRPAVWWVSRAVELPLGAPLRLGRSRAASSREGVGISVSTDPAYWADLLELPGPAWELRRLDGAPGRFALWGPALWDKAARWAEAQGWVTLAPARRLSFFDAHEKRWVEDAATLGPSDAGPAGPWQLAWRDRASVVAAPTDKLRERLARHYATGTAHGETTQSEAVNLWVAAHCPDLDGVWFSDRIDPSRGVLLPHALPRWAAASRHEVPALPPSPRW